MIDPLILEAIGRLKGVSETGITEPSEMETLRMALGNTAAMLGDALATYNKIAGKDVFKNGTPDSVMEPCVRAFSAYNDGAIDADECVCLMATALQIVLGKGQYHKAAEARSATVTPNDERTAQLLAAISVASMQNTRESAKQRIERDNPYWTAAYGDVCSAVDREMAHREERERLEAFPSATLTPEISLSGCAPRLYGAAGTTGALGPFGLTVHDDHALPDDVMEFRDRITGRVLGKIINVGKE